MSANEEQRPITREDLRQELGHFKGEIQEFVTDSQTKLKADMQEFVIDSQTKLKAEMQEFVIESQTKLRADMQEFVRDAQTEILRAFHTFENNRELRFARLKADVSNLDQEANGRIDNIEKRLMAIEEKLILDPPRQ